MEESYVNVAILLGYPKQINQKCHSVAIGTLAMHQFIRVITLCGPLQVTHRRRQCPVTNKVLIHNFACSAIPTDPSTESGHKQNLMLLYHKLFYRHVLFNYQPRIQYRVVRKGLKKNQRSIVVERWKTCPNQLPPKISEIPQSVFSGVTRNSMYLH